MSLESGRMVTANVRLARLLRRGGMGSVWCAEHLSLGTEVAVKFMAPHYVESDDLVARFAREATSAAQIKSPHVVQILDHGVLPEGLPFIVIELLVGEDLAQRIKRLGHRSPGILCRSIGARASRADVERSRPFNQSLRAPHPPQRSWLLIASTRSPRCSP